MYIYTIRARRHIYFIFTLISYMLHKFIFRVCVISTRQRGLQAATATLAWPEQKRRKCKNVLPVGLSEGKLPPAGTVSRWFMSASSEPCLRRSSEKLLPRGPWDLHPPSTVRQRRQGLNGDSAKGLHSPPGRLHGQGRGLWPEHGGQTPAKIKLMLQTASYPRGMSLEKVLERK